MSASAATLPLEPSPRPLCPPEPPRSAWIEIDLRRLKRNFELIIQDKPKNVRLLSIVKDDAYGHGAEAVARTALQCGAAFLGVKNLHEAMTLRDRGFAAPILILYERHEDELPWCAHRHITTCVSELAIIDKLAQLAASAGRQVPVHLKINTGMNRYGARWDQARPLIDAILSHRSLFLEGLVSHFSMSDELDKSFALLQLSRFQEVLDHLKERGVTVPLRHMCNSGGLLDLPQAHFDMARPGILPLGIFPSQVCRRIPGILPVMTVKARIAAIQHLQPGDKVGYGMRYEAASRRRVAIIPIGYGDGFPRLRNQGAVLIQGRRAPIIGSIAMDAFVADISEIPQARLWDEVVIMGRQGAEEISVHELAGWKNSVSYDILVSWSPRLPRLYL